MDIRPEVPLACDMGVFHDAEREQHAQLIAGVLAACVRTDATETGYRFEFANDHAYSHLAEWIALERRCYPFLDFTVALGAGHLSLELSARQG